GWQFGPVNQILSNATITGSMLANVFELGSTVVGASEQLFTSGGGGKLAAAVTVNTNSTPSFTISVDDPRLGHMQIAEVGEILILRGLAYDAPESTNEGATVAGWEFLPTAASSTPAQLIREIWLEVTSVTDQTAHYDYGVTIKPSRSSRGHFTFPAGTAFANLGDPADEVGGIKITGAPGVGPYISIWSLDETGGEPYQTQHVRVGKLSSLWLGNDDEWGLAAGTSLTSGNAWDPYAVLSNQRLLLSNVEQKIVDEDGNTALQIIPARGLDILYKYEFVSGVGYPQADRQVTWIDEDGETEYFRIGPDNWYPTAFAIQAEQVGRDAQLNLWAAPPPADWVSQYEAYEPRYAGIQLWSRYYDPAEIDNEPESLFDSQVLIIGESIYLNGNTEVFGTLRVNPARMPNTPDDLFAGTFYVDESGFVKMVQIT
ncbi:MAG: hypothetical protein KDE20_10650, partial [Caldilineaceae bacterium]|nr:hypothetical protein [Caldilineaceae bacterium]